MIIAINTELDYDNALGRIDELIDARNNTAEGEELDSLVNLVIAYEAKEFPEFK